MASFRQNVQPYILMFLAISTCLCNPDQSPEITEPVEVSYNVVVDEHLTHREVLKLLVNETIAKLRLIFKTKVDEEITPTVLKGVNSWLEQKNTTDLTLCIGSDNHFKFQLKYLPSTRSRIKDALAKFSFVIYKKLSKLGAPCVLKVDWEDLFNELLVIKANLTDIEQPSHAAKPMRNMLEKILEVSQVLGDKISSNSLGQDLIQAAFEEFNNIRSFLENKARVFKIEDEIQPILHLLKDMKDILYSKQKEINTQDIQNAINIIYDKLVENTSYVTPSTTSINPTDETTKLTTSTPKIDDQSTENVVVFELDRVIGNLETFPTNCDSILNLTDIFNKIVITNKCVSDITGAKDECFMIEKNVTNITSRLKNLRSHLLVTTNHTTVLPSTSSTFPKVVLDVDRTFIELITFSHICERISNVIGKVFAYVAKKNVDCSSSCKEDIFTGGCSEIDTAIKNIILGLIDLRMNILANVGNGMLPEPTANPITPPILTTPKTNNTLINIVFELDGILVDLGTIFKICNKISNILKEVNNIRINNFVNGFLDNCSSIGVTVQKLSSKLNHLKTIIIHNALIKNSASRKSIVKHLLIMTEPGESFD